MATSCFNSVDDYTPASNFLDDSLVVIQANGTVMWMTAALVKASCEVDVALYPFDTQHCNIKFGSWSYNIKEVNLICHDQNGVIGQLASNGEWDLLDLPCMVNNTKYECCNDVFSDITFTVVMRRKPSFYLYNLAFPCIMLCIIGILVFCVPVESGERVSLSVTLLLSMVVFLLVIMDNVPPTSDAIPLLGSDFKGLLYKPIFFNRLFHFSFLLPHYTL